MDLNEQFRPFQATLRKDLSSFIQKTFSTVDPSAAYRHNWHIDAVAWHLEQCMQGKIRRLIITLPPRNLKSICASVAFPAWVLGLDPARRIIVVSYSEDLAKKHSRDSRAVMEDSWYRALFPWTRLDPRKNTELEFVTTRRGFRLATSVGGTLTGRGGNIIIIDDPLKPTDAMSEAKREAVKQWYNGTLYSRLDSKADDVIILVMQRLHVDDLVGHVLEQEPWVHLNLAAIAESSQRIQTGPETFIDRRAGDILHPEHESRETLDDIKSVLGTYAYSAQYLQSPVPAGGTMIKWSWFRFYDEVPPLGENDRIIQSWDTASKAGELHDYSVCTTWQEYGGGYYLNHVFRERLEYPDLKRQVIAQAERFEADVVLIEDKGSGINLIQDLNDDGLIRPIPMTPEGDKVIRMSAQSAKIEAGYVYLPKDAPWLQDFQTEILQFPHGRHDDQVDSLSQFLGWVSEPSEAVFHVS
ncbi:MAG: phage terminase large subunit [Proteobacteria bacterium]|nr:phage terminase large subunit [Pseudomonadota bacterium]